MPTIMNSFTQQPNQKKTSSALVSCFILCWQFMGLHGRTNAAANVTLPQVGSLVTASEFN